MAAECKLIKQEEQLGDHIMFVGEVVEVSADERIKPLIYHNGKYWKLGGAISKPALETLDKIKEPTEIHRKF
jgi:flavin reductase (DIM6/NTAB) family NADH-FMN oxidoreductase RutF